MTQTEMAATRGGARRAGRRKVKILEAAGRVIAERGADATRFADVAAWTGPAFRWRSATRRSTPDEAADEILSVLAELLGLEPSRP
jgi:hypothetical protein